jgi:hypothetical protein
MALKPFALISVYTLLYITSQTGTPQRFLGKLSHSYKIFPYRTPAPIKQIFHRIFSGVPISAKTYMRQGNCCQGVSLSIGTLLQGSFLGCQFDF